jgi:hypothetical protein
MPRRLPKHPDPIPAIADLIEPEGRKEGLAANLDQSRNQQLPSFTSTISERAPEPRIRSPETTAKGKPPHDGRPAERRKGAPEFPSQNDSLTVSPIAGTGAFVCLVIRLVSGW